MNSRAWIILWGITSLVFSAPASLRASGDTKAICTMDSSREESGILHLISSAPCGRYGVLTTRYENVSGREVGVTVQFMVHTPVGNPNALVVLLAGLRGETGIAGNASTGEVIDAGPNFLVRSAQLFAEQGYLAVTIDRPSTTVYYSILEFDQYRVSARHAQDIAAVVSAVNKANLPVLLAGTSRGTLSIVANHKLGVGILLSSPVTSGNTLYIEHPNYANLQPGSVTVPVHIMEHTLDACPNTTPADARRLHIAFTNAGVPANYDELSGGLSVGRDLCGPLHYHGFLGIENAAVKTTTKRMDEILNTMNKTCPGNRRPIANAANIFTASSEVNIDLATLASDPDGDALSFSLPYFTSGRGARLSISGSVVSYRSSQANITDGFVYVVSDGKGGTSHNVVTITLGKSYQFPVIWQQNSFIVEVLSNSTISNFAFAAPEIRFDASVTFNFGMARVTLPRPLLARPYNILIDGRMATALLKENATHAILTVTYPSGPHNIRIVGMATQRFLVTWEENSFVVEIRSNSTISNFRFSQPQKQINFAASASPNTGIADVILPRRLLGGPYTIFVDDQMKTVPLRENSTHATFSITHPSGSHDIKILGTTVIPEFPGGAVGVLIVVLAASLLLTHLRRMKIRR